MAILIKLEPKIPEGYLKIGTTKVINLKAAVQARLIKKVLERTKSF